MRVCIAVKCIWWAEKQTDKQQKAPEISKLRTCSWLFCRLRSNSWTQLAISAVVEHGIARGPSRARQPSLLFELRGAKHGTEGQYKLSARLAPVFFPPLTFSVSFRWQTTGITVSVNDRDTNYTHRLEPHPVVSYSNPLTTPSFLRPRFACAFLLFSFMLLFSSFSFAFSALKLLVGRQEGHPACKKLVEWWGAGVVVCLERGADLHMPSWCHCHALTVSCFSKIQIRFYLAGTGPPG